MLRQYKSHKVVTAVKIAAIEFDDEGSARIAANGEVLATGTGFQNRFNGDENDLGYYVAYHDGYESWSPTKAFEDGYHLIDGMTFGAALEALKLGSRVARAGWNGKGMWVVLMPELHLPPHSSQEPGAKVNDRTAKHIGVNTPLNCKPYIAMWTAQQEWQPGWLASQADMLADDWTIVLDD